MKKQINLFILVFLVPFLVEAQGQQKKKQTNMDTLEQKQPYYITNGAYTKDHNQQKSQAYKYPKIKEKDIVWSRTIWRSIDLRQKINHHLYYPAIEKSDDLNPDKMSLIDVVMEALHNQATHDNKILEWNKKNPNKTQKNIGDCYLCKGGKKIKTQTVLGIEEQDCYQCKVIDPKTNKSLSTGKAPRLECFKIGFRDTPGNEFRYQTKSPDEILGIGTTPKKPIAHKAQDGTDSLDVNGDPVMKAAEVDAWDRTDVQEWLIKEEWFFDKTRSVMDVRIIGLCPVVKDFKKVDASGNITIIDRNKMFWIYYPDFRDILARTKIVNITKNDAQQRSYLDVFEKRMFSSRITMESNIMNREISDYMIGLDALLEADRIQESIFNIEHDLWEY